FPLRHLLPFLHQTHANRWFPAACGCDLASTDATALYLCNVVCRLLQRISCAFGSCLGHNEDAPPSLCTCFCFRTIWKPSPPSAAPAGRWASTCICAKKRGRPAALCGSTVTMRW